MSKQVGNTLFLTIDEVALKLGCSSGKVRAYVRQGRLKTIRQGLARMISEEDLHTLQTKRFL